jgi:hypothetical protein
MPGDEHFCLQLREYRHCREQNISYRRPIAMPANDVFSV